MSGLHLFPRRKAGDNVFPEKGRLPVNINLQTIQTMFCMPQPEACKALSISLTALKQVCRKLGITRWPYQRPCKRGKRYRPRTSSTPTAVLCETPKDAIAIPDADEKGGDERVETEAPETVPAADEDDQGCMSDSADSCSSASTLQDSSHPGLAAEGICTSESGTSEISAATCHQHAEHQSLCEEVSTRMLDAEDDHDLGWLVNCEDDSDPVAEDVAFEMAWEHRYSLEAQKLERERTAHVGHPVLWGCSS